MRNHSNHLSDGCCVFFDHSVAFRITATENYRPRDNVSMSEENARRITLA